VSAKKTERLLNLVICLLHTRRYLSVQEIRTAVPGYAQDTEESFRRMFERDKDELRELGIPLETGTNSAAHDDEPGVPDRPARLRAAGHLAGAGRGRRARLAARLWQSAPLAGATGSALLKLRAAGVQPPAASASTMVLEPRVAASEPAFESCLRAVRDSRAVRFSHRAAGGREPQLRSVEPWGVVSWRGRWYLVGHDTERSRLGVPAVPHRRRRHRRRRTRRGGTPRGRRPAARWSSGWSPASPSETARVSLRPGAGAELRRRGRASSPTPTARAGRSSSSASPTPSGSPTGSPASGRTRSCSGRPLPATPSVRRLEALAS
jgi:proteasome accessory factor B